jgi:hypothetical protein
VSGTQIAALTAAGAETVYRDLFLVPVWPYRGKGVFHEALIGMIIQIENALTDKDCRSLTRIYDEYVNLSKEQYAHLLKDHGKDPILFWRHLKALADAREIVRRVVGQCAEKIIESFELVNDIYPETVILTRFGPGAYHPVHADNSLRDERGNWVPNHSPRRELSAIYYLNEDFEGGELVFDQQRLAIKPRVGLLVAFPGDGPHAHEVLPVRTGVRYAMPIWFTTQEEFSLRNFYGDPADSV